MTVEKQLIEKMFYETFMKNGQSQEPAQILGDVYLEENKKDIPDLSAIRFAQGEVYFHYKDYETAIFKWENIQNELAQWARKNMADAYFELGLLPTAEEIYKTIITDDMTLNTEVSLHLFSLYIEWGKLELATQVIKETIVLNPDYPNLTSIARSFFEEYHDRANMVELAVNEAVRTESVQWYDVLLGYVERGYTKKMEPAYFEIALHTLANIDTVRFEKLAAGCWNYYQDSEVHIAWMVVMNRIISEIERERIGTWLDLSRLYKESYLTLINGSHLIKEISALIPNLLTNWLKISDNIQALSASAAVVSWNEMFPSTLKDSTVREAENLLLKLDKSSNGFVEAVSLAEEILKWAKKRNIQAAKPLTWMIDEIKRNETFHIFTIGTFESGKSSVINSIVGSDILSEENSTMVIIENGEQQEILEITEMDVQNVALIADIPSFRQQRSFHVKLPSAFLQKRQLSIVDTPSLSDNNEFFTYLHAADGILFVLNANTPFTKKEEDVYQQLRRELPDVPIHFLINKMDAAYTEKDAGLVHEVERQIKYYGAGAKVFAYSPHYNSNEQLNDLDQFLSANFRWRFESAKTTQLLYFIRETISYLLKQRLEKENELVDSIKWNEEMVAKLNGAIHQLRDVEAEKVKTLVEPYHEVKEKMKAELLVKIPQLLRECSELVKEDSNFGQLHIKLNEEMNNRIQKHLQDTAMPEFYKSIQKWIADCTVEFNEVQFSLNEMCDSFNDLYNEEKLKLEYDFKVLDDWRRDADRMTSGIHWEKINILLRYTPAQILLKGAGKIFSALPQNNTMLYNKYKNYVETADYHDTAELAAFRFLQQFELFEKTIDRDISFFFRNPLAVLSNTVEETRLEITANETDLEKIRENPESYQDPLTLFELKLREYEWINQKETKVPV